MLSYSAKKPRGRPCGVLNLIYTIMKVGGVINNLGND